MHRTLLNLFRFVLNLSGCVIERVRLERESGHVEIDIRRHRNAKPRCSVCNAILGGDIRSHLKKWRHLDIIKTRTIVACQVREGFCVRHGRRTERVPWAHPGARHTTAFDLSVSSLAQVADKSACSRMFGVAWRTVGRIITRVVNERLPADRLDGLKSIGVDETSYKRGHRYITVVCNLATGAVVWVGEGKSSDTLGTFFDDLGKHRARELEVVCMDMSEAFATVVRTRAENAAIVYDKFHVVKLLLDAIDEVRRDEARELEEGKKKELKGLRYAFLRNPRHEKYKDEEAIRRIQSINAKLARAYQLRVDFEDLWDCDNVDDAEDFLSKWTRAALLSRRPPLRRFASTVRAHLDGILNIFRFRVTNATLEGTNNKIKLLIHKAYGFRSLQALFAMIHLCCSGIIL